MVVDHRLVGLFDSERDGSDQPPLPHAVGHWLSSSADSAAILLESDEDILSARLRLEAWDEPATFDQARWPKYTEVTMLLPSGRISVDEIAAGGQGDVFLLPAPGRYQVRVAWHETGPADDGATEPEAFALAQFWPLRAATVH